jgi:nitroreductase
VIFEESFEQAWRERYGSEPGLSLEALAPFLRHRSVREFSNQPVAEEVIEALVACAQSASTSSHLQLYSMVSVQDPERRVALNALTSNQKQVATAPWFFAFLADQYRLAQAVEAAGESAENLDYTDYFLMAVIDAALAAERMTVAAESLGLGVCYIGALRNDHRGLRDLLDLPEGVFGVFGLCLGYPAEDCKAAIKPRMGQKALWFRERYQRDPDLSEFQERAKNFYESQGQDGSVSWAQRSGRRLKTQYMTGRERLKPWLEEDGMGRR